jgi:hypothetical protein
MTDDNLDKSTTILDDKTYRYNTKRILEDNPVDNLDDYPDEIEKLT